MKIFSITKNVNELTEELPKKLEDIQNHIEKIEEVNEIEIIDIDIKIRPLIWGTGVTHQREFREGKRVTISEVVAIIKYKGTTIDFEKTFPEGLEL